MKETLKKYIYPIIMLVILLAVYAYFKVPYVLDDLRADRIEKEWKSAGPHITEEMQELLKSDTISRVSVILEQNRIVRKRMIDEFEDRMTITLYADAAYDELPFEERFNIFAKAYFKAGDSKTLVDILEPEYPLAADAIRNNFYVKGSYLGFHKSRVFMKVYTENHQSYKIYTYFDDGTGFEGIIDNYGVRWDYDDDNKRADGTWPVVPVEMQEVWGSGRVAWENSLLNDPNVPEYVARKFINERVAWEQRRQMAREKEKAKNSSGYSSGSGSYSGSSGKSSSGKSSGSSGKSYYDSYDDGYHDVLEDEDYDWDRYRDDSDYAAGVDDALDEEGWDW